jgi:hypothetical protein
MPNVYNSVPLTEHKFSYGWMKQSGYKCPLRNKQLMPHIQFYQTPVKALSSFRILSTFLTPYISPKARGKNILNFPNAIAQHQCGDYSTMRYIRKWLNNGNLS